MAHFLEHLVFKGGEKYDDYRKVNETAERMGAVLNAYTSHDLVAFHITVRAEAAVSAVHAAFGDWNVGLGVQWDPSETRSEKGDVQVQYKPQFDRVVNVGYRFRGDNLSGTSPFTPERGGVLPAVRVGPLDFTEVDGVGDAVRQLTDGRGADVVLVDTAGRLHTKTNLMEELRKLRRVLEREGGQVREVLLVLDATTGQNGLAQARQFTDAVGVTGVVLTKLDGTAKGGIVIAVQRDLGIPVKLVGLGEGPHDLAPFDPDAFVDALLSEDGT
jgi:hypothetical protein